jgi:hypothetical protein
VSAYAVIACDVVTDGGECMSEDSPPGLPKSATDARRRLKREGWHRTKDGRDI